MYLPWNGSSLTVGALKIQDRKCETGKRRTRTIKDKIRTDNCTNYWCGPHQKFRMHCTAGMLAGCHTNMRRIWALLKPDYYGSNCLKQGSDTWVQTQKTSRVQILNKQHLYSLGSIFLPSHYIFYLILLSHSVVLQQKFKIVSRVFHRSLLSSFSLPVVVVVPDYQYGSSVSRRR